MSSKGEDSKALRGSGGSAAAHGSGDRVLREALRQEAAMVPDPPAHLPDSLMLAVAGSRSPGGWRAVVVLVRAQWPVVFRERLVSALAVFLAVVFAVALQMVSEYDLLTLAGALPIAAGLLTLLLSGPWVDPAHAVVSTTRTPFGAVVFARTTVALVMLVIMAFVGSLVLAVVGERLLLTLVAAWLGPTVVIAALATLLAQVWRPLISVTAALVGWAVVIVVIALEMNGVLAPAVALASLVRPGAELIAVQAVVGVSLLVAGWLVGSRVESPGARA